jgi:hypothetical protein
MRDPDTARHQKRATKGQFGIQSRRYKSWYATAKAHDRALENLTTKTTILKLRGFVQNYRKIER